MPKANKSRDPDHGGVMHWKAKMSLFYLLLDADTDKAFAEKVLKDTRHLAQAAQIADLIPRWVQHWPTQAEAQFFFETLADKLPTKDRVNSSLLKVLTIDDYIKHLPYNEKTSAVLTALGYSGLSSGHSQSTATTHETMHAFDDDGIFAILHHDTGPVETIQTGIANGRIDQKHYYMDPDSAREWSRLVNADAYPTYGHCKKSLEEMVRSVSWRGLIAKYKPSTIVMLTGGGAATKDLIFLQSLLDQPYQSDIAVNLHLVDISFYMLTDSMRSIREHMRRLGFERRVHLEGLCGDVLKMPSKMRKRFHEHGSVVFAITGGTIGNLKEDIFFSSLNRVASPDDLLVVSADTIDHLTADSETQLKDAYNNEDLRRFLRPVLRNIVADGELSGISVALGKPDDDDNPSKVPGSRSVILTLETSEDDPLRVLTSTRYRSSELIEFAAKFKWEFAFKIPCSVGEGSFTQFVFRRNLSESS